MKILFVVPPLTGDKIDENHVRVEHHHADGLTYTDCLINGVVREVRSTSKIDTHHPVTRTKTILVHLKSLPKNVDRLKCADLPDMNILHRVRKDNMWPGLSDYRQWFHQPDFAGLRLIRRKQNTLVRKGYVREDRGVPFLTDKGLKRLGLPHAGN